MSRLRALAVPMKRLERAAGWCIAFVMLAAASVHLAWTTLVRRR